MKSKNLRLVVILLVLLTGGRLSAQNFGIGVASPVEKLDVAGAVKVGNTTNTAAGSLGAIRYTGTDIEGLINVAGTPTWVSLTATGSGGTNLLAGSGITITGTAPNFTITANNGTAIWNANQLNGTAVSGTAPTVGQILVFNGTSWAPTSVPAPASGNLTSANAAASVAGGTGAVLGSGATITINNSTALWNANQLQGRNINSVAPTNGQVLTWNNGTSQWEPTTPTGGVTYTGGTGITISGANVISVNNLAGDVTGAPNANTVARLQGRNVANTAPTNGQVLTWNNGTSQWEPTTPTGGVTYTGGTGITISGANVISVNNLAGDVTGAPNANTVARLQGRNVANTAPTNGQVLTWNNGTSQWEPANIPSVTTGDLSSTNAAASVATGAGRLVGGNATITVNNSTALWNASQIQGRNINNTAPANGQVLTWNNGTSQWEPTAVPSPTSGDLTSTNAAATVATGTSRLLGGNASITVNNSTALWNANMLQGRNINNAAPINGQVLTWNNGTSQWEPTTPTGGVTYTGGTGITISGANVISVNNLAGDVTGAPNATTVARIQGVPVSAVAPALGQILIYNGAQWTPSAIPTPQDLTAGNGIVYNAGATYNGSTARTMSVSTTNGISIVGTSVGLGGALTQPTTITTSAANTLTLAGLQASAGGGIVTATAGGTLRYLAYSGNTAHFLRGDGTWAVDNNTTYTAGTGITISGANAISANGMTGATGAANGVAGMVPQPMAGEDDEFLRGDGTWVTVPSASAMTGATAVAAGTGGTVPAPAAGEDDEVLFGNGTWAPVPGASAMTGATAAVAGAGGTVPAPAAGEDDEFLRGDGTWATVTATVDAQNGLNTTASGTGAVELGGTLLRATNVAQAGFNLTFTGNGNVGIGQAAPTHRLYVSAPNVAATRSIFADHPSVAANVTAIEGVTSSAIGAGNTAAGVLGRTTAGGSGVRGEGVVIGVTAIGTRTVAGGGSVGLNGSGASYGTQSQGTDAALGIGVFGLGNNLAAIAAAGTKDGATALGAGVIGGASAIGVQGIASNANGFGVWGVGANAASGFGVVGAGNNQLPAAGPGSGAGVLGNGLTNGVYGIGRNATTSFGVVGVGNAIAVVSLPPDGAGVVGNGFEGVRGVAFSDEGYGVAGINNTVPFFGDAIGVYGESVNGVGVNGEGGVFGVFSLGDFGSFGTKAFYIDHPADPANKALRHFCVESDEVLNVYRGTVQLDANGEATIELKGYVELVNRNFSYHLTAIGSQSNVYVKQEVSNGQFAIAGGQPNQKVSWMIYGERNDPYLQQNPDKREVEVEKKASWKGKYLVPSLYGQPDNLRIFPRAKTMQEQAAPIGGTGTTTGTSTTIPLVGSTSQSIQLHR